MDKDKKVILTIFFKFLKEEKVYNEYIINLIKWHNLKSKKELYTWFIKTSRRPTNLIYDCFSWSSCFYNKIEWVKLYYKWEEYCRHNNLV